MAAVGRSMMGVRGRRAPGVLSFGARIPWGREERLVGPSDGGDGDGYGGGALGGCAGGGARLGDPGGTTGPDGGARGDARVGWPIWGSGSSGRENRHGGECADDRRADMGAYDRRNPPDWIFQGPSPPPGGVADYTRVDSADVARWPAEGRWPAHNLSTNW